MKSSNTLFVGLFVFFLLKLEFINAQTDTLINHNHGLPLSTYKYDGNNQWGFYSGHNHLYRQQYAEKYYVEGDVRVVGVISHHTGVFANPNNIAEFNVYNVGSNRLPSNKMGGKQILFKDIDYSGNPMITFFNNPINVSDSFFVSFNLFDYAHGGYEGDTIAILCSPDGSRNSDDFINFGRNAVQRHNHSFVDWRDFMTQNFTPVATHFAIYPLIEVDPSSIFKNSYSNNAIEIISIFPNPVIDLVSIRLKVNKTDSYHIKLYDLSGKEVLSNTAYLPGNIEDTVSFDLKDLNSGMYFCIVFNEKENIVFKILK